jgi:hypothetical protein
MSSSTTVPALPLLVEIPNALFSTSRMHSVFAVTLCRLTILFVLTTGPALTVQDLTEEEIDAELSLVKHVAVSHHNSHMQGTACVHPPARWRRPKGP